MEDYKREFIEFMVESDVLKFGEFTLKSGRKSPFFMNAGAYVTGEQLKRLGEYYAKAIHDNFGLDFDVVFGPAYKGIPLAVVTAIALQELYGKEVRYCCNRKEAKDHGADAGNLLGATLNDGDRVIMVEDVTTSGKSIDETYPIVTGAANVEVKGLIVSLNRMEVGKGGVTTAQKEIQAKYGFPVASIVSMAEVTETLYNHEIDGKVVINDDIKAAIDKYYEQYGAKTQRRNFGCAFSFASIQSGGTIMLQLVPIKRCGRRPRRSKFALGIIRLIHSAIRTLNCTEELILASFGTAPLSPPRLKPA